MCLKSRQTPREEVLQAKAMVGPILKNTNYNKSMKASNKLDNCAKVKKLRTMRVYIQSNLMVEP